MPYEVKDDEFALIVKPLMRSPTDWTGEVKMGMTFNPDSTLPVEVQMSVVNIVTVLSVVMDYCKDNPDILDELIGLRNEFFADQFSDAEEDEEPANENNAPKYRKSGNLIQLDVFTKTEGNA